MGTKRLLAVAVCAAALAGVGASGAFAGEVKGPLGSTATPGGNPNETAAHTNSNSAAPRVG
jgi:hypothetical protein